MRLVRNVAYFVASISGPQRQPNISASATIASSSATITAQGTRSVPSNSNPPSSSPQQGGPLSSGSGSRQLNNAPPSQSQQQGGPSTGNGQLDTNFPSHYQQQATWRWILFGVDAPQNFVQVEHILIHDLVEDMDLYRFVTEHYRKHRGVFKLLFSIWQLGYCDGVKVSETA
jgi:hypothetical protein